MPSLPDLRADLRPAPLAHGDLKHAWTAALDEAGVSVSFGTGGEILVVDACGDLTALDAATGALRWREREVHAGGALALSVAEEHYATTGLDGRLRVGSMATGEPLLEQHLGASWLEALALSPDGRRLAVGVGRTVRFFSCGGGRWRSQWTTAPQPGIVSALAWATPDELVATVQDRVSVFDVAAEERLSALRWSSPLVSLAVSPSGDLVACGARSKQIHLWRRSDGVDAVVLGYALLGYAGKPSALAFDSASLLLATAGGPQVIVWSLAEDAAQGRPPGVLELHLAPVNRLRFAPRARLLASAGRDGLVVVWQLERDGTGRALGAGTHNAVVTDLAFAPAGEAVVSVDESGVVACWRLEAK